MDSAVPRLAKLLNHLLAAWPWEGSSVSPWSPRDGHVPGRLGEEGLGVHAQPASSPAPLARGPSPQMTYSLTRFAIYETVRDQVAKGSQGPLPFYKKVLLGSLSGE